ncbi:MAG: LiaF domain-containing protein [Anaerolineae bacterium]
MDDRQYEEREPREERYRRPSQQSLFWPVVLIGVGVIWLLANLGVLAGFDWTVLLRLWPVLLIAIGLDILLGRRWPFVGALVGLATVGLVIVLLFLGPALGLEGLNLGTGPLETTQYAEPVDSADSARITLGFGGGRTTIGASEDSDNVITAEMRARGDVIWETSGGNTREITLRHGQTGFIGFNLGNDVRSDVRLNPDVPMALDLSVGSGVADMDLSELQITDLELSKGSGSADVDLPSSDEVYPVRINNGSGDLRLVLADGAQVDMDATVGSGSLQLDLRDAAEAQVRISQGSGSTSIQVPTDVGVRLISDVSSGSLNVGPGLERVEEGRNRNSGTWETEGFADAERQVVIDLQSGSGSVTVR